MKELLAIDEKQAHDILCMLKYVASCDGTLQLHDIHKGTIEAIGMYLFKSDVDAETLQGTIEGAAEKVPDPEIQRHVMNLAGIFPFLEEEHMEDRVNSIELLGKQFGYKKKFIKELHGLCHNSVMELGLCQLRGLTIEGGMPIRKIPEIMLRSFVHLDGNKKELARYESFQTMDDHIFGKVMTDYYRDNHFPLPGTPGAVFSNMLKIHDMHHVLAGYPTTPLGEICVIGFADGMADMDLGKAVIGYVAQFQVGLIFDKGLESWKNQFDPEYVIQAFERGANCNVNFDTLDFDLSQYLEEPIDDVRERFNISMEGAIMQKPDDLWCGDLGIVGSRKNKDHIERKATWFQRILAKSGKNVQSE